MKKRILSLLLALLMMISVCPPLAFAMGNNITIKSTEENTTDPLEITDEKQEETSTEDIQNVACH